MPRSKKSRSKTSAATAMVPYNPRAAAQAYNVPQSYQRNTTRYRSFATSQQHNVKGTERLQAVKNYGDAQIFELSMFGFEALRLESLFQLYEFWYVHNIRFEFVPLLANTSPGTVHMCPEYDPLDGLIDENPEVQMSQMMGYKSGKLAAPLSVTMTNPICPSGLPLRPHLYTSPTGDERSSQFGRFYVYVQGSSAAADAEVGTMIIHYDITFFVPQMARYLAFATPNWSRITNVAAKTDYEVPTYVYDVTNPTTRFTDGGATPQNVESEDIHTAIINGFNGDAALKCNGHNLKTGDRVYLRGARFDSNAGTHLYRSQEVGGIFRDWMTTIPVAIMGAINTYIELRDIWRVSSITS